MQGHVRVAFERLIDKRVRHVAHDLDQSATSHLVHVLPSIHDTLTSGPLRLAGQYMRHILRVKTGQHFIHLAVFGQKSRLNANLTVGIVQPMFDTFLIEIMVIDKSLDHTLVRLLEEEVRVCVLFHSKS